MERYISLVVRWNKAIVVLIVLFTGLLGIGVERLEIDHDVRTFLSPDDSLLRSYDDFQQTYGPNDNFFIVVVPENEDVFTPASLALIHELGIETRDIPYFSSVVSIAENPYAPGLSALTSRGQSGDEGALVELRELALTDPMIVKRLVAPGGRAAAVKVSVVLPTGQQAAKAEALAGAREVIERVAAMHPQASLTLAGNIAVAEALSEAIAGSLYKVSLATFLLILLMLVVITRSAYATIATLLVMTLSVEATMGVVGWLGIELTVVAGFIPAAIASLAVADSIHLLVGYHAELRDGSEKMIALRSSVRQNAKAIFLTSLTSILGVLTLNFSDAPPYRDMGNMIAVGIAFAFLMSMLLWPALMAWFPEPRRTPRLLDARIMSRLGSWVVHRRKALLLIVGTLSLLLISQGWRNTLTESWHEYLGPQYEARVAIDTVTRYFGGIHHVYYSLESGGPDGAFDPEYLETIDAFAAWLRQNERVSHVASLVDVLSDAGLLTRDSGHFSAQPAESIKASLRLAGLAPREPGETSILSADNSASIVEVTFVASDSSSLIEADEAAQQWLDNNAPQVSSSDGLGLDLVFSRINLANVRGMLVGATIALLVISLLLIVLLRSVWLGLVSLIPNLVPIGLAFGAWGLVIGQIDMAASVVIGISLGLVVDDTVHFLCKYDAARSNMKRSPTEAITHAYGRVATAIVVTSAILVVGMAGALYADITPTRETAALLMATIGFAVFADLLLLPPLLSLLDRRK